MILQNVDEWELKSPEQGHRPVRAYRYQSGPRGALLGTKAFLCTLFSCLQEKGFSLLGFPWIAKGRFKQLLIREGRKCRKKPWCRMGQGPPSPLWGYTQQSDTYLWILWPLPRRRMVTSVWAQAQGPQTGWNHKADDWDSWNTNPLPHHQPLRRKSHTLQPSPPNFFYKSSSLKTTGEFRLSEHDLPIFLAWPLWYNFLCAKLQHLGLFGLTVHWARELGSGNNNDKEAVDITPSELRGSLRFTECESTQNNKREGCKNQDCMQRGPADQNLFCLSGIV